MVDDFIKNRVIHPSNFPWIFPIVVVKKLNGVNRMYVDYRTLNAQNSETNFSDIGGGKFFVMQWGVKDLSSGNYQVLIATKDRQNTAFSTLYGQ